MTAIERKRGAKLPEPAFYDEPRPGGPSSLESDQCDELFEDLQNPPQNWALINRRGRQSFRSTT